MHTTLTIVRYPKKYIAFALFAMALHRIPLWLNKNISFYKLLGCGKNGTFDRHPDWQQWGILAVHQPESKTTVDKSGANINTLYGPTIDKWFRFFHCETWTIFLEAVEGHGQWDGKEPFGTLPKQSTYTGVVATLTRATIRLTKLKAFWKNVPAVAGEMAGANGFIASFGIGEIPYIKQATFSIWQNKNAMKEFAYQMQGHTAVIRKTRQERWYSEDMFVRFRPVKTIGTIKGMDPLTGKF